MQQLGTGTASMLAGFIVIRANDGRLLHYDKLGYASIVILGITYLLGKAIFQK
jgi:hypothetical protein